MLRWVLMGLVAAVGCALVVVPGLAHACSCVPRDPGASLRTGAPALIAEVLDKQPVPAYVDPLQNPQPDQFYLYTLRVERAFNADFGPQLTIQAPENSSTCGFSWNVGQRVGAFVYRNGGEWSANNCGLIDPAQLEAAANEPDPKPDPPVEPQPPGAEPVPVLRARAGKRVVDAGPRAGQGLDRLVVKPGARIRLRLAKPAKSVKVAPARANGKRLGRMRSARVVGKGGLTWLAKLPGTLPRRTDRLLVAIDYGDKRVKVAVGLTIDCPPARKAPKK